MNPKEFITAFYKSDALYNPDTMKDYLHDDVVLEWYSSKGYFSKDKLELLQLASDLKKAYDSSVVHIHDVIVEDDKISVRYTHHASTIENPSQYVVLAHFIVHWELKDGKLYRGWQMSQLPS